MPDKYFIVTNNEIVRLRYLLCYGQKFRIGGASNDIKIIQNPIIRWIQQHKSIAAIIFYVILLLAIGLSNSQNGFWARQFLTNLKNAIYKQIKNFTITS